ncbi:hypothetical protein [Pleurocapsa sp. FMAR1]|uniref:hypothetical protein n=1 Tax=Pleurocapsa sp. FMAR1 TaxID=3040204 RepID=UPI0029C76501|nr:hypothetical protein [Pleurocapsa sp. FMAR1]
MSKKLPRKERRFQAIRRLEGVEIRVQKPCTFSWGDMQGDRLVRKCPFCCLNVYDFARMSRAQILALVNQHEGKLCAQFYARADGTMTVEPCHQSGEGDRFIRGGLIISRQAEVGSATSMNASDG